MATLREADVIRTSPTMDGPRPNGRSPSRSVRRRAVPLALVVALGVVLLTLYRFAPFGSETPTVLGVGAIEVADDGGSLHVTTSVTNPSRDSTVARVFWLLASPGDGPEWDRRAYQSGMQTLRLGGGETLPLAWSERPAVPPGSYQLSAWAHTPGRAGFGHAGTARGPVVTVDIRPDLFRARPVPEGMRVTSAAGNVEGWGPSTLAATIEVVNRSDRPQTADLRVSLVPLGDRPLDSWWRTEDTVVVDQRPVALGPGQSTRVSVERRSALAPGDYLLRATLESSQLGDAPNSTTWRGPCRSRCVDKP